ncbi:MAG: cyclic nucleotide-binding domain-containing protein [Desulfobacterales bacterium]|nr:cyclic nucleotide-binding domain-containing protein [Desulfobacterales bacterium]
MLSKEKIASIEMFKGFGQEELEEVAELCEEVTFNDGDRILTEGQNADHFFILEDGSVDLRFELPYRKTSKEMTVTTIGPGECFGWSALVRPHKTTLSCYSTGKSRAIRMGRAELLNLCERNNHIGFVLMQKVATVIGDRLTKQQAVFIKEVGDSLQFKW